MQRAYDKEKNKLRTSHKTQKYLGVMFVEAEVHGELPRRFRNALKETRLDVKVVEKPDHNYEGRISLRTLYAPMKTGWCARLALALTVELGIYSHSIRCIECICKETKLTYVGEKSKGIAQ